jgi:hypothetical protein
MFGCLKGIINAVILILAFIGFWTLGGKDWVIDTALSYLSTKTQVSSEKIVETLDVAKIPKEYTLDKGISMPGVITSSYEKTGQKMVIADTNPILDLKKDDFNSNKINEKIDRITNLTNVLPVKAENVELLGKSSFTLNGQNVPYVKVRIILPEDKGGQIEGIIGVVETKDGKQKIIAAGNEHQKYSQQVAEGFFRSLK